MRRVWIMADLPEPLAAKLQGGAVSMVVVLEPSEVVALGESLNVVAQELRACVQQVRTLCETVETRGADAPALAGTLRRVAELLARSEMLHDMARQLIGRAIFISGEGGDKGAVQ